MEAKKKEVQNLQDYGTFDEVKDEGQMAINSQWIITWKERHICQKTEFKDRLLDQ